MIIVYLILWFFIYRLAVGKFRTWVEGDQYVVDLPLPLWLYVVFALVAAAPVVVIALLLP